MSVNLNDWLGDHPAAWWLVLVVLMLGAELLREPGNRRTGSAQTRRLREHGTAAVLALAALAAAATALVVPAAFWVQVLAALLVAAGLGLRRRMSAS